MIRVVTLDSFEPKLLGRLCQVLYGAFGVGCEHSGGVTTPPDLTEPFDAARLVEQAQGVRAYPDDKLLYVTRRPLQERTLPSGKAPTQGFALYSKGRALVSSSGLDESDDAGPRTLARHALHQLGHLWDLHHCLDPRCAMYAPWTPSFVSAEAAFCSFCREKSEKKIRLAKS